MPSVNGSTPQLKADKTAAAVTPWTPRTGLQITVSAQDTVTQLVSAVRKVAREVPGAAEQIAVVCSGHAYSRPGKPQIDWDDPQAKDALVSALVNDANALVAALAGAELDEAAASALALLALI